VKVTIIDSDESSRKQLQQALEREKLAGCLVTGDAGQAGASPAIWLGGKDENPPIILKINENDNFTKPVRVGAVLDRVRRHLAGSGKNAGQKVVIGPFELDTLSNELLDSDDRAIRLTDKERQILVLLKETGGKAVDREALLEKVWGYAPNLETHTLETHIYRLRQKIERDPAQPEILLTDGAGYKLI